MPLLRLVLWTLAIGIWIAVLVFVFAATAVLVADLSAASDRGVEWGGAALSVVV